MQKVRYSVVVPVHNEEDVLAEFYARLRAVLDGLGEPAEIVFVNDGSRDRSLDLLKGFHAEDKRVRIVSLSRNFSHQAAISARLAHAAGDLIAVLDADLQDPPELLPTLFREVDRGWDVAYGVRAKRRVPLPLTLSWADLNSRRLRMAKTSGSPISMTILEDRR